ncbi:uncharacterized protein [Euphorbia lathyris]|uniref:uncharacterized protein isoform X2 n=1 Tax=Euphorbia lathyris TaxID=212925 RepID=UPI003313EFD4
MRQNHPGRVCHINYYVPRGENVSYLGNHQRYNSEPPTYNYYDQEHTRYPPAPYMAPVDTLPCSHSNSDFYGRQTECSEGIMTLLREISVRLAANEEACRTLSNQLAAIRQEERECQEAFLLQEEAIQAIALRSGKEVDTLVAPPSQTHLSPQEIVEDVLVKVDKLIFPVDFVVLDMEEDDSVPILLGRPFLATSRTLIDVHGGKLVLRVQDKEVTYG